MLWGPPHQGFHHLRGPTSLGGQQLEGPTTLGGLFLCQIKKGPKLQRKLHLLGAREGLSLPLGAQFGHGPRALPCLNSALQLIGLEFNPCRWPGCTGVYVGSITALEQGSWVVPIKIIRFCIQSGEFLLRSKFYQNLAYMCRKLFSTDGTSFEATCNLFYMS